MSAPARIQSRRWLARPRNLSPLGIHSDDTARALGFAGGFVPGVALYEHIVADLLNQGLDWTRTGAASFRFRRPVYDNEEVAFAIDGAAATWRITSLDGGEERAAGALRVADPPPSVPRATPVVPARAPLGDPAQIGVPLAVRIETSEDRARASAAITGYPLAADGRIAYPVGLWINPVDLLKEHFDSPVTIHYAGRLWHHGPAYVGDTIVKRGHITGFSERNGNQIVAFTVAIETADGRPLVTVEHQSVYALARAKAVPG